MGDGIVVVLVAWCRLLLLLSASSPAVVDPDPGGAGLCLVQLGELYVRSESELDISSSFGDMNGPNVVGLEVVEAGVKAAGLEVVEAGVGVRGGEAFWMVRLTGAGVIAGVVWWSWQ